MNDDERRESTGFPAVTSPAIPGNTPSAVNGRGRKEGCSSDDSPLLRSGPPVQSGIDEIADEEGKKRGGGGIGSCRRRSPAARHRGNARRGRIQRDLRAHRSRCGVTDAVGSTDGATWRTTQRTPSSTFPHGFASPPRRARGRPLRHVGRRAATWKEKLIRRRTRRTMGHAGREILAESYYFPACRPLTAAIPPRMVC